MVIRQSQEENDQSVLTDDILEPGKSYESLEDFVSSLIPDQNPSFRRLNITTLGNNYGEEFNRYAEPDREFDLCYLTGGANPSQIDMDKLDTNMGVAVVGAEDRSYIEQSVDDAEKISISGRMHYVIPRDDRAEEYLENLR